MADQSRIVDHTLSQLVSEWHIRHPDDVAFWRETVAFIVGHAFAYADHHTECIRWSDTPTLAVPRHTQQSDHESTH